MRRAPSRRRSLFLAVAAAAVAAGVAGDSLSMGTSASAAATLVLVSGVRGGAVDPLREAVEGSGMEIVDSFDRINVVAATGDSRAIDGLRRHRRVLRVDENIRFEQFDDVAHRATGVAALRDPGHGRLRSVRRTRSQPFDGRGISIAVIDQNFHPQHEQFVDGGSSKFDLHLEQLCPMPGEWAHHLMGEDPTVSCGVWRAAEPAVDTRFAHGTAVAATAGGYLRTTPSGSGTSGVAPGARLVGLSTGAQRLMFNTVSALHWVLEHHRDPCGDRTCPAIRVVNNSYGRAADDGLTTRRHDPDSPISRVIEALVDDGVVVVFAAGNSGGDGSTNQMNWLGMHPKPGVVTVGALDDASAGERDGGVASFSSRGIKGDPSTYPDVVAPGTWYTIACPPVDSACAGPGVDGAYAALEGTSIAAPYVAGVIALMLEANPLLTPADVERILESTAYADTLHANAEPDPANAATPTSFDAGHGLVDAAAAVAAALDRRNVVAPDLCAGSPPSVTIHDPGGDTTAMWASTDATPADPAHDISAVAAAVTTNSLNITMHMGDVPATEDRLRATVDFLIDGEQGTVDVERSLTGDTFTVFSGPFAVAGTVDPASDSVRIAVRKKHGTGLARAVIRFTYTSIGPGIADADWTHGACAISPG